MGWQGGKGTYHDPFIRCPPADARRFVCTICSAIVGSGRVWLTPEAAPLPRGAALCHGCWSDIVKHDWEPPAA